MQDIGCQWSVPPPGIFLWFTGIVQSMATSVTCFQYSLQFLKSQYAAGFSEKLLTSSQSTGNFCAAKKFLCPLHSYGNVTKTEEHGNNTKVCQISYSDLKFYLSILVE